MVECHECYGTGEVGSDGFAMDCPNCGGIGLVDYEPDDEPEEGDTCMDYRAAWDGTRHLVSCAIGETLCRLPVPEYAEWGDTSRSDEPEGYTAAGCLECALEARRRLVSTGERPGVGR